MEAPPTTGLALKDALLRHRKKPCLMMVLVKNANAATSTEQAMPAAKRAALPCCQKEKGH